MDPRRASAPRFFVPAAPGSGDRLTLSPADSRHAARVLRLQAGDFIEVLDGRGNRLRGSILRPDPTAVIVQVQEILPQPAPPPIALAPALLKGHAMDFLIQKATELGAVSISPLVTRRTVVRLAPGDAATKVAAWHSTAVEAAKQCGNAWIPRVDPPRSLLDFIHESREAFRVAAFLRPEARLPATVLDDCRASGPPNLTIITGPEGDFTEDESTSLLAAGVHPITLGPLVLRAETAALAALAVVQHEWTRRGWAGRTPGRDS